MMAVFERPLRDAEHWLPAPGFEAFYEVSNSGQVWSRRLERVLTGTPCKGYINVRLKARAGKSVLRPVHRLVCMAFHGGCPPDKEMVGHLDGNPLNNRADNLAWITRSENTQHSMAHGTFSNNPLPINSMRGSAHPMAKLSEADVAAIRSRLAAGEKRQPIADDFGVSLTCISSIKNAKNWRLGPAGFDQAQGHLDHERTEP